MKNTTSLIIIFVVGITLGYLLFNGNSANTESEPFAKREKCANYTEEAQQQLLGSYRLATSYFYDIFYSPKIDSCIYTYGLLLAGESPNELGSFNIVDYFSGEIIFSVNYDNSSKDEKDWSYMRRPIFSDEVEKYRN